MGVFYSTLRRFGPIVPRGPEAAAENGGSERRPRPPLDHAIDATRSSARRGSTRSIQTRTTSYDIAAIRIEIENNLTQTTTYFKLEYAIASHCPSHGELERVHVSLRSETICVDVQQATHVRLLEAEVREITRYGNRYNRHAYICPTRAHQSVITRAETAAFPLY